MDTLSSTVLCLLGALLKTTRKRGFFVRTIELVCRFLQYGLGRAFKQKPVLKKSGSFFAKFLSSKICLLILDLLDWNNSTSWTWVRHTISLDKVAFGLVSLFWGLINKSLFFPLVRHLAGLRMVKKAIRVKKRYPARPYGKRNSAKAKKLISQKISYLKSWGLHRTI